MATAPAATASGLLRFAASPLPLLLHLAGLLESLGLGLTAQLCSGVMQQVSVRSRLRNLLYYPENVYLDIMVGVQRFRCLRMGEHVMALRRLFDIAANVVRQLCRLVSLQHVLYRQHALPCELLPITTWPCPDACDCSRFLTSFSRPRELHCPVIECPLLVATVLHLVVSLVIRLPRMRAFLSYGAITATL